MWNQTDATNVAAQAAFLQGNPVIVLSGDDVPFGFKALELWATDIFAGVDNRVHHPQLGWVVLNKRSAKDSISHGMSPAKAAAFAALPKVIEHGVVIATVQYELANHVFVCAPVQIGLEASIVTALVKRDINMQRVYLHSVSTKKRLLNTRYSSADAVASKRSGKATSGDVAILLKNLLS